ncbi:hypothetical protein [Prevotella sp. S7 MS 2]|uniref:hypothetical protein n=1 Tax=Prevotella sp. S7 MS 2 TaxID=1287488 RepID=UPI000513AC6D|nr:hypothetical protein [Prevotella sp. S7 MS 2]KGI60333.1 hypothetical protein HMPREF0671_06745 [Prevotella sp. S7 MS 2]
MAIQVARSDSQFLQTVSQHRERTLFMIDYSSLTDVCDEIFYLYQGSIARRDVDESAEAIEQDMMDYFLKAK